jgi:hypothetical protein
VQVLHGNTACSALPHLLGMSFSAAAYGNARARLPGALFERLFDRVTAGLYSVERRAGLWFGHRTWHLDGSSFSMPDTALPMEFLRWNPFRSRTNGNAVGIS